MLSDDEEKPPAPPLRLTSNRGGDIAVNLPLEMRPLPKEPDEKKAAKAAKAASKGKKSRDSDSKPNISYPTKFTHVMHVGFDPDTGEFTGMPDQWTRLLAASNISREMQRENPQAVIDVLNYYERTTLAGGIGAPKDKFMTQSPPSTEPSPRPSYSGLSSSLSSPCRCMEGLRRGERGSVVAKQKGRGRCE